MADAGCESGSDLDEGSEGFPLPEDTNPAAVADSALAGFPASGASYAILSTGDTLFADQPNDSGGTGQDNSGGSGGHGGAIFDLVALKVDVDVPAGLNCLRTDFRFLSDEFPEYVGETVNDAFVAELDQSTFSANPDASVNAPRNFAFDSGGRPVSVNTAAFSDTESAGTTYDGATPRLRASTPISPGRHAVYLSIFDQGDGILDSAVFLDAMRLSDSPGDACATGASSDVAGPAVSLASPANGSSSTDTTPLYSGGAGAAAGDSGTVTVEVFGGSSASGTPLQTLPVARSGASWSTEGPALSPGTYTARARQTDGAGNVGFSSPSTFAITVPVIVGPVTETAAARDGQGRQRRPGQGRGHRAPARREARSASGRARRSPPDPSSTRAGAPCACSPPAPAARSRARSSSTGCSASPRPRAPSR